ncbi:hypothetical protein MUK42_12992 [Musa troglodytarum]|uniref:RING-type E3 ubiquitin transferase n=1 Tax=Musa troglodytarum TaxID=320322 RepID=A0A9E7HD07_9LILI|nr:hypothetical protein MUK42_12992 [Musa troglodytarum]URE27657.1 hypothetical protein MUK42_12992 [Musa troglodytarum]
MDYISVGIKVLALFARLALLNTPKRRKGEKVMYRAQYYLHMAPDATHDDDMRTSPEVIDSSENEDVVEVSEHVNSHVPHSPKPNLSVSGSMHKLLECPVCLNAMYPPIHQCSNGRTLCSGCKPRVHSRCPTCRHELGNIRCLAYWRRLHLLLNCLASTKPSVVWYCKLKHESQCTFRPYTCPYAGSECTVAGDIPYLVTHLKDDHKVDMHIGSSFNHRYIKSKPYKVENATWMLMVFSCFGQYFCVHFEAFQLGMALGGDNESKCYSYSLEVGGYRRKITRQGVP